MKLLRVGEKGSEIPAMLGTDGILRDLSGVVGDIGGDALSPAGLDRMRQADQDSLPVITGNPRIGPCIARPVNYVCIGLNYADHAAETNSPIPKEPIVFLKSLSAFSGPYDDVVVPRGMSKVDWEVELGVVIGTTARYVPVSQAMAHVAGYCVANDVSEREYQLERGGTWDKGKGCDSFGPTGPWLVTSDELPDPRGLAMWVDVDEERMQSGNTRTMIFDVATIVSYVSELFTLHPGDIIITGTPPGVGLGKKPQPVYLRPGQIMETGIAGLGVQRQRIVEHR